MHRNCLAQGTGCTAVIMVIVVVIDVVVVFVVIFDVIVIFIIVFIELYYQVICLLNNKIT